MAWKGEIADRIIPITNSVEDFLKNFVPGEKPKRYPSTVAFDMPKDAKKESELYEPLCDGFTKLVAGFRSSNKLVFKNHNHTRTKFPYKMYESENHITRPDVIASFPGETSIDPHPDPWRNISFIVEAKLKESEDPMKSYSDEHELTLVQLAKSAGNILVSQSRQFVFVVGIYGSLARIFRFDHAGAVCSRAFNYTASDGTLSRPMYEFLWRCTDPIAKGTTSLVMTRPCVASRGRPRERASKLRDKGIEIRDATEAAKAYRYLTVGGTNKGTKRYLAYELLFMNPQFISLATTVWNAIEVDGRGNPIGSPVVIKDAWRELIRRRSITTMTSSAPLRAGRNCSVIPCGEDLAMECGHQEAFEKGILHRDISEGNVMISRDPAVPYKGYVQDFDYSLNWQKFLVRLDWRISGRIGTNSSELTGSRWPRRTDGIWRRSGGKRRRLYAELSKLPVVMIRMTKRTRRQTRICRCLPTVKARRKNASQLSSEDVAQSLGTEDDYRDEDSQEGVDAELDEVEELVGVEVPLASPQPENKSPSSEEEIKRQCKLRTGTLYFKAIDLLSPGDVVHEVRHDLESFFWLFIWILLRHTIHLLGLGACERLFNQDDEAACQDAKTGWFSVANVLQYIDNEPLTQLVSEFTIACKTNYRINNAEPSDPLTHKKVLEIFDKALALDSWPTIGDEATVYDFLEVDKPPRQHGSRVDSNLNSSRISSGSLLGVEPYNDLIGRQRDIGEALPSGSRRSRRLADALAQGGSRSRKRSREASETTEAMDDAQSDDERPKRTRTNSERREDTAQGRGKGPRFRSTRELAEAFRDAVKGHPSEACKKGMLHRDNSESKYMPSKDPYYVPYEGLVQDFDYSLNWQRFLVRLGLADTWEDWDTFVRAECVKLAENNRQALRAQFQKAREEHDGQDSDDDTQASVDSSVPSDNEGSQEEASQLSDDEVGHGLERSGTVDDYSGEDSQKEVSQPCREGVPISHGTDNAHNDAELDEVEELVGVEVALASPQPENESPLSEEEIKRQCKLHTGTLYFKAIDLLSPGDVVHEVRHDLESFFWLLIWILLCHTIHILGLGACEHLFNHDDEAVCRLMKAGWFDVADVHEYVDNEPLAQLVSEFAIACKTNYRTEFAEPSDPLTYKKVIDIFEKALALESWPTIGDEAVSHDVLEFNKPPRQSGSRLESNLDNSRINSRSFLGVEPSNNLPGRQEDDQALASGLSLRRSRRLANTLAKVGSHSRKRPREARDDEGHERRVLRRRADKAHESENEQRAPRRRRAGWTEGFDSSSWS
ncbi:hypothetical protein FOMPIDRAFT_1046855 [Fomitopsis schrenkii]|uniref:Fungal-type protein kinase domain-containing protein n=1 Tax=Fomitopsis schrenkii TaxID=2126942 RepID=S8EE85_FOMSC|nr:hypothetical protein FOMPIDRAFT_1046855 [Fomitopsis schrenkii]